MEFWLRKAEWVAEGWRRAWAPRAVTLYWSHLVWRPARGFPSPGCHPDDQIIVAGALIWWMLRCLYKLSSSAGGRQKKTCNEQKRTWTWASCTEMSTACVLFKWKGQFWFWPLISPAHRVQVTDFSVLSGSLRGILIQPFSNSLKI